MSDEPIEVMVSIPRKLYGDGTWTGALDWSASTLLKEALSENERIQQGDTTNGI